MAEAAKVIENTQRDLNIALMNELALICDRLGLSTRDVLADAQEAQQEYGIQLVEWQDLSNLDALVLAVSHQAYLEMPCDRLLACLRPGGVLMDVKSSSRSC